MERKGGKRKERVRRKRKASLGKAVLGTEAALGSLKAASLIAVPQGQVCPGRVGVGVYVCEYLYS